MSTPPQVMSFIGKSHFFSSVCDVEGADDAEAVFLPVVVGRQRRLSHRVAADRARAQAFRQHGAGVLPRAHVEQAGARAVRRRSPVGGAEHRGHHHRPFLRGDLAGHALRAALGIEAVHPVHLHERLAEQELAGDAIEHVGQPVAVGPQHHLPRPAAPLDVGEHRHLRRVVVHLVVRRELVVPFQRAGVGVERDDAVAIEVVAQTRAAVPVGRGLPVPKNTRLVSGS